MTGGQQYEGQLGDPRVGDTWVQFAQIQAKQNGQITLAVSDEHGSINKRAVFAQELFNRHFRPVSDREKTFVKRVKVDDVVKSQKQIKFSIVDEKDRIIQTNLTTSQRLFSQTYHVCLSVSFKTGI